jgi:signal transduction histidine kinase
VVAGQSASPVVERSPFTGGMTGSSAVVRPPVRELHAAAQGDEWPTALLVSMGLLPVAVAVTTFAITDADRPWLLALLLAASVATWVVEAAKRCPVAFPGTVIGAAAVAVLHLAGEPLGVVDADSDHQIMLFLVCFAVGEALATRTVWETATIFVLGTGTAVGAAFVDPPFDATPVWLAAMFLGLIIGGLVRRLILAVDEVKHFEASRERQRIARDVHDVIAHSMTVTMLHLTAARMAVGRGDTAGATEALEEAERAGRRSLADIRSTVGLLRADDAADAATSAPIATDLDELVAGYRSAGMRVDAEVDDIGALPVAVALAVHRIVQQALSNVAQHAPGAGASVRVAVGEAVDIDVVDTGGPTPAPPGNGHGLLGMRERAESLGGRVEAGPTGSGWRVHAVLPMEPA